MQEAARLLDKAIKVAKRSGDDEEAAEAHYRRGMVEFVLAQGPEPPASAATHFRAARDLVPDHAEYHR